MEEELSSLHRSVVVDRAKELSYFKVDTPSHLVDGITTGEYNVLKGAIAGPVLLVTAPFACAIEEACKGKDILEQTQGVVVGFGHGLIRGVVGGTALVAAGLVTGLNQLRTGIQESNDSPGQGRGFEQNFDHLMSSSFTDLARNVESTTFKSELDSLIAEGKLPPQRVDCLGNRSDYQYQFFIDETPTDALDGFNDLQYNVGKGIICGATLAVCAPFKDAHDGYYAPNHRGEVAGVEGALKGFGCGLVRGSVGGAVLATTGVARGTYQLARGVATLSNLPRAAQGCATICADAQRLVSDPLLNLVLQKGYGLEEFIEKEDERIRIHDEQLAARERELEDNPLTV